MNKPLLAESVMVALDYPDAEKAEQLVRQLAGIPCYFKVGMELFYAAGPDFVGRLKEKGHKVFADLKLHDIPNTVKGAARSLTRLQVDMFNVHCAGGEAMLRAAVEGVEEVLSGLDGASRPLVIGVTQLTSTSREVMNLQIGIPGSVEETVLRYAGMAQSAGLDGVVASPLEVTAIKTACGADFVAVTPGIRPKDTAVGDQSRVMTPAEAAAQGSDYLVIGRPITAAPDPRAALESILEEMTKLGQNE